MLLGCEGQHNITGKETVKYGGDTSCIEVRCGKEIFILDAGNGIRKLGSKILKEKPQHINILFYHDPSHDDKFTDKLEKQAQKEFKESYAAYEGMEINL